MYIIHYKHNYILSGSHLVQRYSAGGRVTLNNADRQEIYNQCKKKRKKERVQ